MRQNGEPSVEEILQSIKQVIARDVHVEVRDEVRSAPRPDIRSNARPDDRSTYRASYFDDDYGNTAYDADDDVLELQEASQLPPQAPSQQPDLTDNEDGLVQPQARNSMRESLAALAMISEPGAQPQIVRSGETSLESLTRELLRPALAEWLDKNLPPMVERLVAAEIARIVGKKS